MYERNRQTELLIDLDAMIHNYNEIQKHNPDKIIFPVLKASGYGIGIKNVNKFLEKAKLNYVATAIVDEGVILRDGLGFKGKIITLNQPLEEDIPNIIQYDITVGVCYIDFLKKLNNYAIKENKICNVHLEIETGMGRTGINIKEIENFLIEAKMLKNINIEGIYTHFATSDDDLEYTNEQINIFNKAVESIKKEIANIKYEHTSNSGSIININNIPGNAIRPGIMLYGYLPNPNIKTDLDLKSVCKLKSKISFIKEIEKDRSISYGRTFITKNKSVIATIPIGYADGIKRSLSNKRRNINKWNKSTYCWNNLHG